MVQLGVRLGTDERKVPRGTARSRICRDGSFTAAAIYGRSAGRMYTAPTSQIINLGLRPSRGIEP